MHGKEESERIQEIEVRGRVCMSGSLVGSRRQD